MDHLFLLELLRSHADTYLSGSQIASAAGISRAAVWKHVEALRALGYTVEAVPRRGYRLTASPDTLSQPELRSMLPNHPWYGRIHVFDTLDSTNSALKRDAGTGLPAGTVYIAREQSAGRGRLGKSFLSPPDAGLYLSVLLRPDCTPDRLPPVTAMAAVAAGDAVAEVCGLVPEIKWMNDLLLNGKKIAGILTESSVEWESGALEYIIIGIGINCSQKPADFPDELARTASSLETESGSPVSRSSLAAALIRRLGSLSDDLLCPSSDWMETYTARCATIGREVRILQGNTERTGTAVGLDADCALIVETDGRVRETIRSGIVSIRGKNGYI